MGLVDSFKDLISGPHKQAAPITPYTNTPAGQQLRQDVAQQQETQQAVKASGPITPFANTPTGQQARQQYAQTNVMSQQEAEARYQEAKNVYLERVESAKIFGKMNDENVFVSSSVADQIEYARIQTARNAVLASGANLQKAQEAEAIRAQDNMIFGIIQNPLQQFDKPLSELLAKSPIRQSAARLTEKAYLSTYESRLANTPTGSFFGGMVQGAAQEAQLRPTKFLVNLGIGYGLGKVFTGFEAGMSGLSSAGLISTKTATTIPKLVSYGMGIGYVGMSGLQVAAEPTWTAKGQRTGKILFGEALPLTIGGLIATTPKPLSTIKKGFGFTSQFNEVKTIDLTKPVIDLRPEVDLSKSKISVYDPLAAMKASEPVTAAERAMLIRQYGLTKGEISLAKSQKLSVNQILHLRNIQEKPPVFLTEPKTTVATRTTQVSMPEVDYLKSPGVNTRKMYGFVPEIFSTQIKNTFMGVKPVQGISIKELSITGNMPKQANKNLNVQTVVNDQKIDTDVIRTTLPISIVRSLTDQKTVKIPIFVNPTPTAQINQIVRTPKIEPPIVRTPKPLVFPVGFLGKGGGGSSSPLFFKKTSKTNPVPTLESAFGKSNLFGVKATKKRNKTPKRRKSRK